jgi:hypothetical protein
MMSPRVQKLWSSACGDPRFCAKLRRADRNDDINKVETETERIIIANIYYGYLLGRDEV